MYCRVIGCVACEAVDTCDGLDNNCDGMVDNDPSDDKDKDGFPSCGHLGGDGTLIDPDCNDNDPAVFPGANEVCNGVDDDCDGVVDNPDRVCAAGTTCDPGARRCGSGDGGPIPDGCDGGPLPPAPSPGDIVITEVMYDPKTVEPQTEWFEVYNAQASARLLSGLTIVDGASRTHVIAASPPVTIGGKAYVVLVNSRSAAVTTAKIPDNAIAYEYGGSGTISLSNDAKGAIGLQVGSTVLTNVPYGTFAIGLSGASIQSRTVDPASSATATNWCVSTTAWSSGSDLGTPGASNNCP